MVGEPFGIEPRRPDTERDVGGSSVGCPGVHELFVKLNPTVLLVESHVANAAQSIHGAREKAAAIPQVTRTLLGVPHAAIRVLNVREQLPLDIAESLGSRGLLVGGEHLHDFSTTAHRNPVGAFVGGADVGVAE